MTTPAPVAPAAPAAPAAPVTPASQTIQSATPAVPASASPPAATGANPTDWTAGFSDDTKGWITTKGFKNAGDVADSARNLEKLYGVPQERILKLPEDMNTPEGRAIWEKLGAPKTPQEYGLDKLVPKEGGDPKLAEWAAGTFHELGIPRTAAEKILTKWNERTQAEMTASKENQVAAITQGEAKLKQEWGQAYDQNLNLAKAGMRALELDAKTVDILEQLQGREKLFKMLHKVGAGVGESGFVAGRPAADGVLAPEQARQKIKELGTDPLFTARYLRGEADAKNQMMKLQEMAHPGEFTI